MPGAWTYSPDDELAALDEEIAHYRRRVASAERAPLEGRMIDPAEHARTLRRLRALVADLAAERARLAAEVEA